MPAPSAKPKPKPSPAPAPRPAHVYRAPTPVVTYPAATPQPTYRPRPVQRRTKRVVHRVLTHKRRHVRVRHVVTTPKVDAHVKGASVVRTNDVPTAAAATDSSDATRRPLVIAGLGLSVLLFLLVLAVPATGARFTAPGRVLMDHQLDLVLIGAAVLLLTALVFAVTGTG